ncbi:amino acid adenylation domain-containing protein [Aetokthonos hydrillicola Thurmond2011]|jgi:amino acid adenylation domain-containing protein|uniref:Amino acid adenylation domain-containing protein n=1 Tax=Aetokthonos hydrillicola Thurmond2011 TaxID=2712845 RepID=A0AAP5I2K7_9CYAN|nr:non-ribosomal peptide synthetase [Aetokthonos hydrillicola]MBO3458249.1 amino acid adenylation domain-containing protein [Aetokthonos hydrillicola CCALA 1050]MBW4586710.1 amino acid adenylation domain-containing protein [Aetokthonos hydrillicola CCALA 1050]MDR9893963.1 amino acid adenylation domain-containing protein [Aetokthonos hydrillicola Thurmond2011]
MNEYTLGNLTDDEELNFSEEAEVFVFPTSFAQQRLWFLDQLAPGNPFYNVSAALRLTGSLKFTALKQTFNEIVRRHETLRTTFIMLEQQPVQAIAPSLSIPLPLIDLRNFDSQERETQARQIATQEAQRPFNLSTGSLLRVKLLQLDEAEYVLLLNLHHIVADGWSIGVLVRELGVLYKAFASDQSLSNLLPELPIQYADFAQWQREWLQGVGANGYSPLQKQLAYWQKQLDGISVLSLPTDRLRSAVPTYRGAKQFIELPNSLTQALEVLSYSEGATLFMTMLAAFQTLLYRYTQQEDITVGSPIANRNRSELEGLIGCFVNSLVLRTDFSGNPTFRELLRRVREVTLGAYSHQDLPFEKLVEELHPERDLSYHPFFQVVFSLQNTPIEALELPGITLSVFEFDTKTAKLDLEFHLWQDLDTLKGEMVYSTDLFDDATITRMLGHFQTLLESVVANPEQRLSDLSLITVRELQELLIDWNDTKRDYSHNKCFHQLFEAQVEETPDAIALVFGDEQLSYRELNRRSNQLAHYLQKIGVETQSLVGICVERSPLMIIALLGIFKAGGAYLPLDPSLPQERLNFMLEDAKVSVLLTHSSLAPVFNEGWRDLLSVICIDEDWATIKQYSQENPISCVTLENLAYVIYTSGSTGKPKGVLLQHRGLSNLAEAQIEVFNLQPSNRILQFASLSFDASIFEIVMALRTGATLYLANKESLVPGQPLLQLLREKAITHVTLPPAVLAILPSESLPALQTIICAGESCTEDIVKRWWKPQRRFFNAYGLTESTVWSTVVEIDTISEKPPIGRPIANTQIYILDKHLQPLPIGIPGELYIGSDGLAQGYINRPEFTNEKFIPNPFIPKNKARLYKTGDLARYLNDGNIEFLGRIDNQVKIRGFRIELSEIETALSQHKTVQKAVVITKEHVSGDKYLVAYIVPNLESQNFVSLLRNFLKEKLPEYMVPKVFVVLDSLPLTANGKVDRRALTELNSPANRIIDKTFIAPRTPTESTLAKIWAEVLNVERVGIYDNFFDLGGDSLLTVRLLKEIGKQLGRELPLSTLFLNPTIESLAASLSDTYSLAWSPLVPIQPAGSNPAFFCVHPIFGVVFPYYELATHLGKNQPFYGLQPVGLDGKTPPLTRIEDMASHYIEALRKVQPQGPYFLGGWSFGSWVAFEMAQQLQKSGEEVALLAVLDTLAPIPGNIPSLGSGLKFMLTTVARYIWPFFLDYFYLIIAIAKDRISNLIARFPNLNKVVRCSFRSRQKRSLETNLLSHFPLKEDATVNAIPEESKLRLLSELAIRPMLRVFYANSQAVLNYVPQTYPKRINVFRTEVQSSIAKEDPSMDWDKLTLEGTEIYNVPGNHLTMLRKPHIQVLAIQLKACIEKAQKSK